MLAPGVRFNMAADCNRSVRQRAIQLGCTMSADDQNSSPNVGLQQLSVASTLLSIPLLREDEAIGVIVILCVTEVGPFTEKQIELVKPSPIKPSSPSRTCAYSRNCRFVTATSPRPWNSRRRRAKCLKVISRSTFDLQPVLDPDRKRGEACGAEWGFIYGLTGTPIEPCGSGTMRHRSSWNGQSQPDPH